jgi:hypothetical protein
MITAILTVAIPIPFFLDAKSGITKNLVTEWIGSKLLHVLRSLFKFRIIRSTPPVMVNFDTTIEAVIHSSYSAIIYPVKRVLKGSVLRYNAYSIRSCVLCHWWHCILLRSLTPLD